MNDFTLNIFHSLLKELKNNNFNFITFKNYILQQNLSMTGDLHISSSSNIKNTSESDEVDALYNSICILRHDVDLLPENSLATAYIENEMDIKGTYYFRIIPKSYNEEIIKKISRLGHEIGYHYEDVDLVLKNNILDLKRKRTQIDNEKLVDLAYESFCKNLDILRRNFDIDTICMHGSPLSKFDNKMIWEKYNYKDLELLGEPYFDIDWNKFGYITDTGRKWDGSDSSVRDKVESKFKFKFKSTQDIISNIGQLPAKIMITVHPQRWNDNLLPWLNEYLSQNIKNTIKKYFYVNDRQRIF